MVKGMARYPPNLMITNKNKLHITGCCFWGKKVTSYDIFAFSYKALPYAVTKR